MDEDEEREGGVETRPSDLDGGTQLRHIQEGRGRLWRMLGGDAQEAAGQMGLGWGSRSRVVTEAI